MFDYFLPGQSFALKATLCAHEDADHHPAVGNPCAWLMTAPHSVFFTIIVVFAVVFFLGGMPL
jgi:hypothetical protein